ncbi:MAG: S-layer homology domain-containing protein [Clostridia bacterium]|nr:S-layer homology domain-containing protein [Clostridia bacterium]
MKKVFSLILALILAAGMLAAVPAAAKDAAFSDVTESMWSYDSINYAVSAGYMQGVGGGKFDPEGSLTRAMVVTVLWRREGSPAPKTASGFEDVPAGQWYADAVAWAKEESVVNGVSDKRFDPDGPITREQLAAMLFRFSPRCPVSVPERADLTPFADDGKVSDWADEAMKWAVESGLIKGTDGNRLAPDGSATREQFAAIIARFDGTFKLAYNVPVIRSHYTEKEYPLVSDADFYVSTTGSDANDGSFGRPFATFERAVEAVRELDKTGKNGITVAFMAGDYGPLEIALTAEDSGTERCPITYCKYGDGDVTFDNGFNISLDEFEPISESEKYLFRDKYVPNIRKVDLSDRLEEGEYDYSCVLVSPDRFYDPARYPNKYEDGSEQLMRNVGERVDDSSIRITNRLIYSRLDQYHTYEDLRFAGTFAHTWFYGILDLESYDRETKIAAFRDVDRLTYGISANHVFGFEVAVIGASEELDHDGEYWLDRDTRTLYVYDPKTDFSMATRGSFFDIEKAAYISFVGLDFKNTKSGFAFIDGHDITLDRCSVIGAADNLFSVPNAGIYNFRLTNSEFGLLGAGVGRLDDSYPRANNGDFSSCGIVIDNNYIHDFAMINTDAGIRLFQTTGASVTHNVFERGGRCGIELWGSSCVTIEYNVFDRMMLNSTDGGCIYDNQGVDRRDIVIRHNLIMNMPLTSMGEYGIYLDQNQCGVQVVSNLFYNAGANAVLVGCGRDNLIRDNAIIATVEYRGGVNLMDGATVQGEEDLHDDERYYNEWKAVLEQLSDPDSPRTKVFRERWPDIFNVTLDLSDLSDPNCCLATNNTLTGNRYFDFNGERGTDTMNRIGQYSAAVSTIRDNEYYTTADNPLFVNPSIGDYRLKDGTGFPDFHFEEIGRY